MAFVPTQAPRTAAHSYHDCIGARSVILLYTSLVLRNGRQDHNSEDLATRRQATGKDKLDDKHSGIWTSNTQTEIPTLIQNGTFSLVNKDNKHLFIPELGIAMAKYCGFRDSYEQQPFLRIFDINSLNQSSVDTMLNSEWSPTQDEDRIIMRTASFGHGRQRLDMCIREESAFASQKPRVGSVHGLNEIMFVTLAIVQAFRVQGTFDEEKIPPPLGPTRRERKDGVGRDLCKA